MAPIAAAGRASIRFPFQTTKSDATKYAGTKNGSIFLSKVKESGHATLMDEAGKTIGNDPNLWSQAFGSTLAVDEKHPKTKTETSLVLRAHKKAGGSQDVVGKSSAAGDFGKRKHTRSAAENEGPDEIEENNKPEREVQQLRKESEDAYAGRKKARTIESDAEGGEEGSVTDEE